MALAHPPASLLVGLLVWGLTSSASGNRGKLNPLTVCGANLWSRGRICQKSAKQITKTIGPQQGEKNMLKAAATDPNGFLEPERAKSFTTSWYGRATPAPLQRLMDTFDIRPAIKAGAVQTSPGSWSHTVDGRIMH